MALFFGNFVSAVPTTRHRASETDTSVIDGSRHLLEHSSFRISQFLADRDSVSDEDQAPPRPSSTSILDKPDVALTMDASINITSLLAAESPRVQPPRVTDNSNLSMLTDEARIQHARTNIPALAYNSVQNYTSAIQGAQDPLPFERKNTSMTLSGSASSASGLPAQSRVHLLQSGELNESARSVFVQSVLTASDSFHVALDTYNYSLMRYMFTEWRAQLRQVRRLQSLVRECFRTMHSRTQLLRKQSRDADSLYYRRICGIPLRMMYRTFCERNEATTLIYSSWFHWRSLFFMRLRYHEAAELCLGILRRTSFRSLLDIYRRLLELSLVSREHAHSVQLRVCFSALRKKLHSNNLDATKASSYSEARCKALALWTMISHHRSNVHRRASVVTTERHIRMRVSLYSLLVFASRVSRFRSERERNTLLCYFTVWEVAYLKRERAAQVGLIVSNVRRRGNLSNYFSVLLKAWHSVNHKRILTTIFRKWLSLYKARSIVKKYAGHFTVYFLDLRILSDCTRTYKNAHPKYETIMKAFVECLAGTARQLLLIRDIHDARLKRRVFEALVAAYCDRNRFVAERIQSEHKREITSDKTRNRILVHTWRGGLVEVSSAPNQKTAECEQRPLTIPREDILLLDSSVQCFTCNAKTNRNKISLRRSSGAMPFDQSLRHAAATDPSIAGCKVVCGNTVLSMPYFLRKFKSKHRASLQRRPGILITQSKGQESDALQDQDKTRDVAPAGQPATRANDGLVQPTEAESKNVEPVIIAETVPQIESSHSCNKSEEDDENIDLHEYKDDVMSSLREISKQLCGMENGNNESVLDPDLLNTISLLMDNDAIVSKPRGFDASLSSFKDKLARERSRLLTTGERLSPNALLKIVSDAYDETWLYDPRQMPSTRISATAVSQAPIYSMTESTYTGTSVTGLGIDTSHQLITGINIDRSLTGAQHAFSPTGSRSCDRFEYASAESITPLATMSRDPLKIDTAYALSYQHALKYTDNQDPRIIVREHAKEIASAASPIRELTVDLSKAPGFTATQMGCTMRDSSPNETLADNASSLNEDASADETVDDREMCKEEGETGSQDTKSSNIFTSETVVTSQALAHSIYSLQEQNNRSSIHQEQERSTSTEKSPATEEEQPSSDSYINAQEHVSIPGLELPSADFSSMLAPGALDLNISMRPTRVEPDTSVVPDDASKYDHLNASTLQLRQSVSAAAASVCENAEISLKAPSRPQISSDTEASTLSSVAESLKSFRSASDGMQTPEISQASDVVHSPSYASIPLGGSAHCDTPVGPPSVSVIQRLAHEVFQTPESSTFASTILELAQRSPYLKKPPQSGCPTFMSTNDILVHSAHPLTGMRHASVVGSCSVLPLTHHNNLSAEVAIDREGNVMQWQAANNVVLADGPSHDRTELSKAPNTLPVINSRAPAGSGNTHVSALFPLVSQPYSALVLPADKGIPDAVVPLPKPANNIPILRKDKAVTSSNLVAKPVKGQKSVSFQLDGSGVALASAEGASGSTSLKSSGQSSSQTAGTFSDPDISIIPKQ